jgi:hypothetical protein
MNIFARTTADYQALVTSQHANATKFLATIAANVAPLCELQRLAVTLLEEFSVSDAIGNQLDYIGLWVGVPRVCVVDVVGDFFTWDTVPDEGYNAAPWIGDGDNTSYSLEMDDEQYRRAINAKIYANSCFYTKPDIYAILTILFPDDVGDMNVIDNLDMSIEIEYPVAMTTDNTTILLSQVVPLKPAGVSITFSEV